MARNPRADQIGMGGRMLSVQVGGSSRNAHPRTVRKLLSYSVPPGYVRTRPPVRPKLDPFIGIIDRILEKRIRIVRRSNVTHRSGYSSGCVMRTALRARSPL